MFAKRIPAAIVVGQPFKYFALSQLYGFDLTYHRKRDNAPVLGYYFTDMDTPLVLEPVDETCTPAEKTELEEIIRFHSGTMQVH